MGNFLQYSAVGRKSGAETTVLLVTTDKFCVRVFKESEQRDNYSSQQADVRPDD